MKNILPLLFSFCVTVASFAQKKMNPVTKSSLTGISLPAGSKLDSRTLSVSGAKMLLEIESKKVNITLSTPEVLQLPSGTNGGFNSDALIKHLSDLGWTVTVVEGDKKYAWLQKDKRQLMMYFSIAAKEAELYFAEASNPQTQNIPKDNNQTIQTSGNNQQQQTTTTNVQTKPNEIIQPNTMPATNSGFAFTTTNFDDGWTSTVWEDWVQTVKGNIKVLIHFRNKKADAYNSVLLDGLKNAWDVLVAPRYSSASNFHFNPIYSWQSIEFAEADMVERATGKTVHVVLFKKNFSNGAGKYLEFIAPSKNVFEKEFGAYDNSGTASGWDKMANVAGYNKFAVTANDLVGTWSANDYASLSYYYVSGGGFAGTTATATSDEFTFLSSNTYKSDHAGASGMIGNQKFSTQFYKGNYKTSDWNLTLTNRFQGQTEKYDCYFEAIKGGRIFVLTDRLGTIFSLVKK